MHLANASELIMPLTMSGEIDLLLNGNDMTVDGGNVTLSGAGTHLHVPTSSLLNTDDVFVNNGTSLTLHGGTLTMVQSGGEGVLSVSVGRAVGGPNSRLVVLRKDSAFGVAVFSLLQSRAAKNVVNLRRLAARERLRS